MTRRFPALQRRKFLLGTDLDADHIPDLNWSGPDGQTPDWPNPASRTLCYQLDTDDTIPGGAVTSLFFILNADYQNKWIVLPPLPGTYAWHRIVDTSLPAGQDFAEPYTEVRVDPGDHYIANPRSCVVLESRAT